MARVLEGLVFRSAGRQRFYRANAQIESEWAVDAGTVVFEGNEVRAQLLKDGKEANVRMRLFVLENGSVRLRFEPSVEEPFTRYDVSKEAAVVDQALMESHREVAFERGESEARVRVGDGVEVRVVFAPFEVVVEKDGAKVLRMNSRKRFVCEHNMPKVSSEFNMVIFRDPIPHGANAVAMDFAFAGADTKLTGLVERASSMNLADTQEPLRLFNTDAFKYDHDKPIHLYGSVPLVVGHRAGSTVGLFWVNCSDTYAKIATEESARTLHLISETGFADCLIFVDSFEGIMGKYTDVTGKPLMPPLFSLGYHQCKWGYMSQAEVEGVMDGLEAVEIPYDCIWLDVDHLKGYAPFVVDDKAFPDVKGMAARLAQNDRYLVRLCDPHFPVNNRHKQYRECPCFMLHKDVTPFTGKCWPGKCSWPDFLNEECRLWYSRQFRYGEDISDPNIFIWNDMNEPSVFFADQQTFPKNLVHFNEVESRETHNIYGLLNTAATYKGLYERDEVPRRPFILTRSFFAGSQKFAFVWTGDNTGSWEHMRVSIDMIVSNGICGLPFVGADVGGFFNSSPPDLIARWFQVGAWTYTFFREHCVRTAKRREPFLFQGDAFQAMKNAVVDRYRMLAYFYTEAYKTHKTGVPTTRPVWTAFPDVSDLHSLTSSEVLVGASVLVSPVLTCNATSVGVIKPPGRWFAIWTGKELTESQSIPVGLLDVPAFLRGGRIIPVFSSIDVSALRTIRHPLTLYVALDEHQQAEGELYLDDGVTFAFETESKCVYRKLRFADNKLTSEAVEPSVAPDILASTIFDTIVVYGLPQAPASVNSHEFTYTDGVLKISNLQQNIAEDFTITLHP